MSTPRIYHSAAKLPGGDLIIVGGSSDGGGAHRLTSAEVFSAGSEGFSPHGNLTTARALPAVAVLPGGKVVVLGGADNAVADPFAIDLYEGGTWKKAPLDGIDQRDMFPYPGAAWGLPSGKVLWYGGRALTGEYRKPTLIDTTKTPWTIKVASEDPSHLRTNFAHLILRDGRIMISGGGGGIVIFDPTTEQFQSYSGGNKMRHGMIQHPDGRVQLYGGVEGSNFDTSVETFDPATGQTVQVGTLRQGRGLMGSNLLQNGETLHGGGPGPDGRPSDDQVTYNYNTNVSLFTSKMLRPRTYFVSMALNNGRVVYIGGTTGNAVEPSAEIFDSYSAIMLNIPSDTLQLGKTMQVELISGGPVDWTCTKVGTKTVGTISDTGLYTAPAPVAPDSGDENPTWVVITATSKTDAANKVCITIRLTP